MLFKPWRFIICTPAKSGLQGEQGKGANSKKQKNLPSRVGEQSRAEADKLIFKKNKKSHTLENFVLLIIAGFLISLFINGELSRQENFLFLNTPKAQAASMTTNLDIARNVVNNNISTLINNEEPAGNPKVTLTAEGFLSKPLVAETKVTKETKVVSRPTTTSQKTNQSKSSTSDTLAPATGNHYFPYGYCTYYVSQRRNIPWSGNAISWLSGAKSFGFATGSAPQVGAIVVTSEGGRTGHVGMVDAVNGDQITITEMNYRGFGVISSRTISAGYGAIMGYIY